MAMAALVALAVISTAVSYVGQQKAQSQANDARDKQRQANDQQKAQQTQNAADERRAQIREERVKRARVMQASSNDGSGNSSGLFGSIASLQTQLSSNVGSNLGRIQSANTISDLSQEAANSMFASQSTQNTTSQITGTLNLASSIFGTYQSTQLAKLKANAPQTVVTQ